MMAALRDIAAPRVMRGARRQVTARPGDSLGPGTVRGSSGGCIWHGLRGMHMARSGGGGGAISRAVPLGYLFKFTCGYTVVPTYNQAVWFKLSICWVHSHYIVANIMTAKTSQSIILLISGVLMHQHTLALMSDS
jgi:hypothetical protein